MPNKFFTAVCENCKTTFSSNFAIQKFCSGKCYHISRRWTPEEFWARITKTDSCWIWTGQLDKDGYGATCYNSRGIKAHRLAWFLTYGSLPPKKTLVMHSCDNPPCCNPAHLSLGTNTDNMKDMVQKKRSLAGHKHPNSKLTEEQVIEMRRLYATGNFTYKQLGAMFNIDSRSPCLIITRRSWKHVP